MALAFATTHGVSLLPWVLVCAGFLGGADEPENKLIEKKFEREHSVGYLGFTPDGKHLIFSESSGKGKGPYEFVLVLFDPVTCKELRRSAPFQHETGFSQEGSFFSPDGRFLVSGWDHTFVWDVERWTSKFVPKPPKGHLGGLTPLAFAPGGKVLLGTCQTADYKTVSLVNWDLETGQPQIVGQDTWGRGPIRARFLEDNPAYFLAEHLLASPLRPGGEPVVTHRCLYLWDQVQKKKLPQEFLTVPNSGPRILADGLRFVLSPSRNVVVLPSYREQPVSLIPDSRAVVVLSIRGGEKQWRLTDFEGGASLMSSLSPDGRFVAASGRDRESSKKPKPDRERSKPKLAVWDLTALQAWIRNQEPRPTLAELEKQWALLFEGPGAKPGESCWSYSFQVQGHPAMVSLVRHPQEAIPWLKKRLGPGIGKEERASIPKWIQDLNASDFIQRHRASQELKRLVHVARPQLVKALADHPPPETRRRLEEILETTPAESFLELRMLRVIDVLAAINSDEARNLLRTIAEGGHGGEIATRANEVLQRLEKSQASGK